MEAGRLPTDPAPAPIDGRDAVLKGGEKDPARAAADAGSNSGPGYLVRTLTPFVRRHSALLRALALAYVSHLFGWLGLTFFLVVPLAYVAHLVELSRVRDAVRSRCDRDKLIAMGHLSAPELGVCKCGALEAVARAESLGVRRSKRDRLLGIPIPGGFLASVGGAGSDPATTADGKSNNNNDNGSATADGTAAAAAAASSSSAAASPEGDGAAAVDSLATTPWSWPWADDIVRTAADEWLARDVLAHQRTMLLKHPDLETAEWLNAVLMYIWPFIEGVLSTSIKASLEPVLKAAQPGAVAAFEFERFFLGSSPPTITSVRVQRPKLNRDSAIMLDLGLKFVSNADIILLTKLSGMLSMVKVPLQVQDVTLEGTLRVEITFQPTYTYLKEIKLSFLESPRLDLTIRPLKGADLMDIPMFKSWITDTISSSLDWSMLWPTKIVIPYNEWYNAPDNRDDVQEGELVSKRDGIDAILHIQVHQARDIIAADTNGSSDAYCVVTHREQKHKTKVIKRSLAPFWNEDFKFKTGGDVEQEFVSFAVYDHDVVGKNDLLGETRIALQDVIHAPDGRYEVWKPLSRRHGEVGLGEVHITIEYIELEGTEDGDDGFGAAGSTAGALGGGPDAPRSGALEVTLIGCKDLIAADRGGKSDPYVILKLGGESFKSTVVKKSLNPTWDGAVFNPSVDNVMSQRLTISVFDKDMFGKDDSLGNAVFPLAELTRYPATKPIDRDITLDKETGTVQLRFRWLPVRRRGDTVAGGSNAQATAQAAAAAAAAAASAAAGAAGAAGTTTAATASSSAQGQAPQATAVTRTPSSGSRRGSLGDPSAARSKSGALGTTSDAALPSPLDSRPHLREGSAGMSSPGALSSASSAISSPNTSGHHQHYPNSPGVIGPLPSNQARAAVVLGGKRNQQTAIHSALSQRSLKVHAIGWEKHQIGKSARTHYVFVVATPEASWEISRRFSHFAALDGQLRDQLPPGERVPSLPSKGTFVTKDREFKAQRTHALAAYITALTTIHTPPDCVTRFLHEGKDYS